MKTGVWLVVLLLVAGCSAAPAPPRSAPAGPPSSTRAPLPIEPAPAVATDDEPLPPYVSGPMPTPKPGPPAPPPSITPPTPAEEKACAARGGKIEPICMLGNLECVVRYRDGGKRCTDKRDCTGKCLYEGPQPAPAKPVGACERTSDPCQCKAPIVNGRASAAVCVD